MEALVTIKERGERCPLCGSTETTAMGAALQCTACGSLFGSLTREQYKQIVQPGWSMGEPERYFDFTQVNGHRGHGWLGPDGRIAQIG